MIIILAYIVSLFLGYIIGRFGDKIGGHWNLPHHWTYGLILLIIGLFFYKEYYAKLIISFGLGLIISDFNDMINLRFYGPDKHKSKYFWSFD